LAARPYATRGEFPGHVRLGAGVEGGAAQEGAACVSIGKKAAQTSLIVDHQDDALDADVEAFEHLA